MFKVIRFLLVILILSSGAEAQFIRKWEKSAALGNLPSWFSTTSNLQRGIAYTLDSKLLVIADAAIPKVIILNPLTGDSIGTLNTTGISGGLLALSDISTSAGFFAYPGTIYACNLTDNAVTNPFKIYMWTDINSAPQLIVIDSVSNLRLGDRLNVSDEFFVSIKRHLTSGSGGSDKIVDYISVNGNPPFIRNVITLSDGSQGNNMSAFFGENFVYPGGYLVNSDNRLPKVYDAAGSLQAVSPDSAISPATNSIKYFINLLINKDEYINDFYVTYNYIGKYADLVLNHLQNMEDSWGHTPSMGNNTSVNNFGDVEYAWRDFDSLYIFVLSGNNGIGAYHAYGCYLPVELVSFTAEANKSGVLLTWITATEINNKGFEIERTLALPSLSEEEGEEWETIGFVPGRGTTSMQTAYSFKDAEIKSGIYNYRLKQIDFDGNYEYSDIVEVNFMLPDKYLLAQNYPNPFNPATTINYEIAEAGLVSLKVFDILGSEKALLVNEVKQPGNYTVKFDASGLPGGVYIYQLKVNTFLRALKMVLLK